MSNFPINPTIGDIYIFANGTVWEYDGFAWKIRVRTEIANVSLIVAANSGSAIQSNTINFINTDNIIVEVSQGQAVNTANVAISLTANVAGAQGTTGAQGIQGSSIQGTTGVQGVIGSQGIQGIQGVAGSGVATPVVTGLIVDDATAAYISISWNAVVNVAQYIVYDFGVSLGTTTTNSFTDNTVTPASNHSYQVQVQPISGPNSDLSAALAVTAPLNTPPQWDITSPIVLLANTPYSLDFKTVSFDEDQHPLVYTIEVGLIPGLTLNGSIYGGIPTVIANTQLTLRVNDGFDFTETNVVFEVKDPDITAPDAPVIGTVTVNGSTAIVPWTVVTDPSGIWRYNIYRSFNGAALTLWKSDTTPPFSDDSPPLADGDYFYAVSAIDNSANRNESALSANSNTITVNTAIIPDTPINFVAVANGENNIDLSWQRGPTGQDPDDYDINWGTVANTFPNSLSVGNVFSIIHTGRTPNERIYYSLTAKIGANSSGATLADAMTVANVSGEIVPTANLLAANLIVVTEAPYNADPTGVNDSTVAIQSAIDAGLLANKAVWFPSGTYIISDTLRCYKYMLSGGGIRPGGALYHQLVGASFPSRPIIKLANSAPLFDSSQSIPRPMLAFCEWRSTTINTQPPTPTHPYIGPDSLNWTFASNILFLSTIVSIDLHTNGHTMADGLFFSGAQSSGISEMKITATGSNIGIEGLPGRNSVSYDIEIIGGKYAISLDQGQYYSSGIGTAGATIVGLKCSNQTIAVFKPGDFVPLCVVGFDFSRNTSGPFWLGVSNSGTSSWVACFIDGKVNSPSGVAFDNTVAKNMYLRNVYVAGTTSLVKTGGTTHFGSGANSVINEYCSNDMTGTKVNLNDPASGSKIIYTSTLIDGTESHTQIPVANIANNVSIPITLLSRHMTPMPHLDGGTYIQIPYPANPTDDSRTAIQDAINAANTAGHNRVFIPGGTFYISNTINMLANTKLFGTSRETTAIFVHSSWAPTTGAPIMIDTPDNSEGHAFLGRMRIRRRTVPGTVLANTTNRFTNFRWRVGKFSSTAILHLDDEFLAAQYENAPRQDIIFTGNGGGRHYGIENADAGSNGVEFRVVKVANTSQPLSLYGLNTETTKDAPAGAVSLACSEFIGCSNVRSYGTKREGQSASTRIVNANNIATYAHGGMLNSGQPSQPGYNQVIGECNDILMGMILLQKMDNTSTGNLIRQNTTIGGIAQTVHTIVWGNSCSLYKLGTINDAPFIY